MRNVKRGGGRKYTFPGSFRVFDKLLNCPIIFLLIIREAKVFTRAIAEMERYRTEMDVSRRPLVELKYIM